MFISRSKRLFFKAKRPFLSHCNWAPTHTHTYILLSAFNALLPLTALLSKKVWSPNFQSTPAPLNILPFEKLTIPRIGAYFFIGDFFSWLWQHFTIVYVINKKKQIKIILVGKESAVDKCIALKCALSKSCADHMHDKAITSIWMVLLFNKMTFKPSLFTTSIFLIIFNFRLFFISLSMTSIASIHL